MNSLNHSRYLDYFAKDVADRAYHRAKETPTAKQIKFYKKLYALCKENSIDARTDHPHTRVGYAMAIDKLIERLKDNNVDVGSNGKEACVIITYGSDRRGRYYANERIIVEEQQ